MHDPHRRHQHRQPGDRHSLPGSKRHQIFYYEPGHQWADDGLQSRNRAPLYQGNVPRCRDIKDKFEWFAASLLEGTRDQGALRKDGILQSAFHDLWLLYDERHRLF